jgi:Flp pilus assembly protein TadG
MRLTTISLLLVLVWACQGGPTQPDSTELNSYWAKAEMANAAGAATILDAQLLLDGAAVDEDDFTGSGGKVSAPLFNTDPIAEGNHTLTFLLVNQTTTSPTNYRVASWDLTLFPCPGGSLADDGSLGRKIHMPAQTASLTSGQGIAYNFYVPACTPD